MTNTLTNEQESVIAKVEKLLALAKGNSNENEAQSATVKAMELLAAYNLDMAVVGQSPKDGRRDDRTLRGGLYGWQRDLWASVARLNFCKYWFIRGLYKGQSYEHRILGRAENVISTTLMAEYLQDTIERLASEYGKIAYPGKSRFIRELIAYREGMAERIAYRLEQMRRDKVSEDRRKAEEVATRPNHGGNALVLADVIQTEDDLNEDYLYGLEPGTTGKRRAVERARQVAALAAYDKRMAEAALEDAKWRKLHPEEAKARDLAAANAIIERDRRWAADDAKRAKAVVRERKLTSREERMQSTEFYRGYDEGGKIGLDKQIDKTNTRRIS